MNGWVIDLYYRLSGDINAFFVPRDDELSLNYLKWVCHKAIKKNQWILNEEGTMINDWGKEKKVTYIHVY